MKNKPAISVIIPVYNTKKDHLADCFESIQKQSMQDFEVIVVDDGSNKSTARNLDELISRLKHWRVIRQKNQGVSVARNNGLREAKGRYVFFLDADDMFLPNYFQEMYTKAIKNDVDIVSCWFDIYDDRAKKRIKHSNPNLSRISVIKDKDCFDWRDYPDIIFIISAPNPWSKLYKKEFLLNNRLRFNKDLLRAQDLEFTSRAATCAKKMATINKSLVLYRVNTGTSNTDRRHYPLASYQALLSIRKYLRRKKVYSLVHRSFSEVSADSIWFHLRDTDMEFIDNYTQIYNFINSLEREVVENGRFDNVLVQRNKEAVDYYREKVAILQDLVETKQRQANELLQKNNDLQSEISSFLRIRRSSRLLAGNIIRRVRTRK